MNRIKVLRVVAKGENSKRFKVLPNGDSANSVKQIASARFGVTVDYLNNANEIEIKMHKALSQVKGDSYQVLK